MLATIVIFILVSIGSSEEEEPYAYLPNISVKSVVKIQQSSCLLAALSPVSDDLSASLRKLLVAVGGEDKVTIGEIDYDGFDWPSVRPLNNGLYTAGHPPDLLFWPRRGVDRTCLLPSPASLVPPPGQTVRAPRSPEGLLDFINENCGTFRTPQGVDNDAGQHRKKILDNLFHVHDVSEATMATIYSAKNNPFNQSHVWRGFDEGPEMKSLNENDHYFYKGGIFRKYQSTYDFQEGYQSTEPTDVCMSKSDSTQESKEQNIPDGKRNMSTTPMAQCEIISSPPSAKDFFHNYLKRSKPFIIRNMTSQWEGFTKWTNDYLRKEFGQTEVHIKLTPNGDYEGVEKAELWEGFKTFKIPEAVKAQLQFPDLVTVRPAGINMNFSEFMDIINKTSQQTTFERALSAYLEYSSIPNYMPSMEKDVQEPGFAKELLNRKHFNIWLSDGHTLGRLHFDQFDNLLCQISGSKQVILFEPHTNSALYEAHIQQATLSYNTDTKVFRRRRLEDSTSMVMSPVNLLQPDFKRFPLFGGMRPMNCTLQEGDVLYLPSFWWHEVQSRPSPATRRNLAVNFWYEPFLTREFPCPECILDVNPVYNHLLPEDAV